MLRPLCNAAQQRVDAIDSEDNRIGALTLFEQFHLLPNDGRCSFVGQKPLKTVSDLNPHFPLIGCNQQKHAVIQILLSHAPAPAKAQANIFNRAAFKTRQRNDHQLIACLLLKGFALHRERLLHSGIEHPGLVHHPANRLRLRFRRFFRTSGSGQNGERQSECNDEALHLSPRC